ncbi:MAG TPA: CDP-alcohol phosphatidyltransferase family protein [Allosphingosinicella sp.]
MSRPEGTSGGQAAFAWIVHAFTASSAIFALLALGAIGQGDFRLALLWLLAALAVDGVDGSLARWAQVKRHAPNVDGETLDLIVDYLTYVFVPTVFIWRAGLVPENLAFPLAALIQLCALYSFVRRDLKSEDNYFRGFPGLWNIVAVYLWVTGVSPEAGAVVIVLLGIASFAPVYFVHPFRVREWGVWLPLLSVAWALATVALLWPGWGEGARAALFAASAAFAFVLIALGLVRTVRGPRPSA